MAIERSKALLQLRASYERNGYLRSPRDPTQPRSHRGYELRFSAHSEGERDRIVRWLEAIGIWPGKPFVKGNAWRIPVYGRVQVEAVLEQLYDERIGTLGVRR